MRLISQDTYEIKNAYHNYKVETDNKPGIALTESNVSAMCCHLLQKDGERREGGKVNMATEFEDRTMLLRDLINESISHSCNSVY